MWHLLVKANVFDPETHRLPIVTLRTHSRGSMMDGKKSFLFCVFAAQIILALLSLPHTTAAQNSALADQIHAIASRPEYKHSTFGVAVYSLDDEKVVFELHGEELFTPGSTTKLLTEGTALELLGADFRFHTRVYRTGPITANGVMKGDLVLVAGGDPNLSGRIQPDGTLAFENVDHSYDGSPDTKAVPGDPLLVISDIAAQVAAHGVKQIDGRVLVDASLFPEGDRELGTNVVVSPISVNDNVVDLAVSPGSKEDAPVGLNVSPASPYVSFVNRITTGPADSKPDVKPSADVTNAGGSSPGRPPRNKLPAQRAQVITRRKTSLPSMFLPRFPKR